MLEIIKHIINPFTSLASIDFRLKFMRWGWRMLSQSTMARYMARNCYSVETPHLGREVFGRKFYTPVGLAAGFDRNGDMIDGLAAAGFGFIEVGSITAREQRNTSKPAAYELSGDRALIYRGQTDSAGVEQVIENIKRRQSNIMVGCNIVKSELTSAEDAPTEYLRLFRPLYQYADYFTINISYNSSSTPYTPNDKEAITAILTPLFEFRRGQNQYRPILLKISPDLSDEQVDMMTDIMLSTPLDGIVACGGTLGRHGLDKSASTMHSIGRTEGAMCGKPLQKRALEVVSRIYKRSKGSYPIIGCGGISTPDDAMAMLDAGATLVQICNEFIYGGGKSLRNIHLGLDERIRKAELNASAKAASANNSPSDNRPAATQSSTEESLAEAEQTEQQND